VLTEEAAEPRRTINTCGWRTCKISLTDEPFNIVDESGEKAGKAPVFEGRTLLQLVENVLLGTTAKEGEGEGHCRQNRNGEGLLKLHLDIGKKGMLDKRRSPISDWGVNILYLGSSSFSA